MARESISTTTIGKRCTWLNGSRSGGGDDESRKSISCFRRDVRGVVRRKGGNRNKRDGLDGGVVRVLWGTTLQSKCRTVAEILIASCLLLSNLPIKTIQF